MHQRAAAIALALICGLCLCVPAHADGPEKASHASPDCGHGATECAAGVPPGDVHFVPSRPGQIASGHENQSAPVLVGLGLLAFGGLVVSVLNRFSLDD